MCSKRVEITIAPTPEGAAPEANFASVTAAYVHIPFCRRRCFYCDFPISVVGDTRRGENSGAIAQYITHLCQEIHQTSVSGPPLETIFFGGGTPSLLAIAQLETILEALHQKFGIAPGAEISMEMDPGTFDRAHVEGYQAAGVNRVSLGVQAFQAELLQVCGRTHRPEDIPIALDLIRQAGIENVGIDLISGLPQQTLEQWEESLRRAIALHPTHLSVYDLIVEPGTAFARQYRPGDGPLPPEETAAQMYRLAQQLLTAVGYEHYEISNYAKPGYACRHNRVYWENEPYYGFGMGAASYVAGQRFTRPRTRQAYYEWLDGMVVDVDVTTLGDRLLDTLMLGFRLAEGIDLVALRHQFGDEVVARILKTLAPYEKAGWVERPNSKRVRLSDPEGFLLSNTILSTLFEQFSVD